MSETATRQQKKKLPRPDGSNLERYKSCRKWTYRRWAWEFLRRNENFIKACNRVRAKGDDEKQQVADEFGLTKFKDYKEAYSSGVGIPRFTLGKITIKSNLGAGQDRKSVKQVKVAEGQVGVVFDLNHVLEDKNVLRKQLRVATKTLQENLKAFEGITGRKAKPARPKAIFFLNYIRILDCLAAGKDRHQVAITLFPKRANEKEKTLVEAIKHKIASAKEHADREYKFLAVLPGKPKTKVEKLKGQ